MEKKPAFISVKEAAEILGVSKSWLYKLIEQNKLKFKKISDIYVLSAKAVEKELKNREKIKTQKKMMKERKDERRKKI